MSYPGVKRRSRKSFEIRYYDADGERQYETITAKSAKDAAAERTKRLADIARGIPAASKPNTVRFGELCKDVVMDYEVNGHSSTDDIEARFRLHIEPYFGRRKAASITTAQIKSYIVQRQHETPPPEVGTINRELEAIRRAFNLAIEGRKLLAAPYVPKLREDNVRSGFFTRDEVTRLCRCLKHPYDALVWFGFLTGWRYSEIVNLLWRNIDFEHGEIRLDVGSDKNRKGRVFPFSVELRRLLERLAVTAKRKTAVNQRVPGKSVSALTPYVFALHGKPIGQFRKTWARAIHKAGLPCTVHLKLDSAGKPIMGTQRESKGKPLIARIEPHRTFHDLRRSFAREMDKKGMRQGAIKKLGGWKTDSVFNRYNIVSDSDLRDAIDMLDRDKNGDISPKRKRRPQ